jgi:hypothetical protein
LWERHLEKLQDNPALKRPSWTPPPLMRPSMWTQARGKVAAIMLIAFLQFAGFIGWFYWTQVHLPALKTRHMA